MFCVRPVYPGGAFSLIANTKKMYHVKAVPPLE